MEFWIPASQLTLELECIVPTFGRMKHEKTGARRGDHVASFAGALQVLCRCFAGALQVLCRCFAGALQVLCRCFAGALQVWNETAGSPIHLYSGTAVHFLRVP